MGFIEGLLLLVRKPGKVSFLSIYYLSISKNKEAESIPE